MNYGSVIHIKSDCSEYIKCNRHTFIDIFCESVIAESEPDMNTVTFVSHSKVFGLSHWRENIDAGV